VDLFNLLVKYSTIQFCFYSIKTQAHRNNVLYISYSDGGGLSIILLNAQSVDFTVPS